MSRYTNIVRALQRSRNLTWYTLPSSGSLREFSSPAMVTVNQESKLALNTEDFVRELGAVDLDSVYFLDKSFSVLNRSFIHNNEDQGYHKPYVDTSRRNGVAVPAAKGIVILQQYPSSSDELKSTVAAGPVSALGASSMSMFFLDYHPLLSKALKIIKTYKKGDKVDSYFMHVLNRVHPNWVLHPVAPDIISGFIIMLIHAKMWNELDYWEYFFTCKNIRTTWKYRYLIAYCSVVRGEPINFETLIQANDPPITRTYFYCLMIKTSLIGGNIAQAYKLLQNMLQETQTDRMNLIMYQKPYEELVKVMIRRFHLCPANDSMWSTFVQLIVDFLVHATRNLFRFDESLIMEIKQFLISAYNGQVQVSGSSLDSAGCCTQCHKCVVAREDENRLLDEISSDFINKFSNQCFKNETLMSELQMIDQVLEKYGPFDAIFDYHNCCMDLKSDLFVASEFLKQLRRPILVSKGLSSTLYIRHLESLELYRHGDSVQVLGLPLRKIDDDTAIVYMALKSQLMFNKMPSTLGTTETVTIYSEDRYRDILKLSRYPGLLSDWLRVHCQSLRLTIDKTSAPKQAHLHISTKNWHVCSMDGRVVCWTLPN